MLRKRNKVSKFVVFHRYFTVEVKCYWLSWDLASLKCRYFCCLAFCSCTGLVILMVLQEVTNVLIHLGAHSGVGMWHSQCLAHWAGSGLQHLWTNPLWNWLWGSWQSGWVDDRAGHCSLKAALPHWSPWVAQLSTSSPAWAADGAITSWGYLAGERCWRMPWKLVPYREPILKHPSRKHTSVCSLLMQPLQRTLCTEIPESRECWWGNAPHTKQKPWLEVEAFFSGFI